MIQQRLIPCVKDGIETQLTPETIVRVSAELQKSLRNGFE